MAIASPEPKVAEDAEDARQPERIGESEGDGDELGPDDGWLPIDWRLAEGLPPFDDVTSQHIDNLLAQIATQVAHGNSAKKWVPAEDDLLLLLRQHRFPYAHICAVSKIMVIAMASSESG